MRIRVKGSGHNIRIPIPTGLIFSKPYVWLYLKLARKFSSRTKNYIPEDTEGAAEDVLERIPDEALFAICAEIKRIKRRYGSWELVNVRTADGEEIQITL